MRICNAFRIGLASAVVFAATPALAFDPTPDTDTPAEAFNYGYNAYRAGDYATAVDAIGYAADRGYTRALWLLGQMYATGNGVEADDGRAFDIFAEIVNAHAGDRRLNPDAPFVADAYVALGDLYRRGVDGGVDVEAALQMYWHAATYYDDVAAQYNLAIMFYRGETGPADPAQAVRWAHLAAEAGDPAAQALLGYLLVQGEGVARQPLLGLAYLNLARARTGGNDPEIRRMHEEAFAVATETERRTAEELANAWLDANTSPAAAAAAAAPAVEAAAETATP